jgi:hypothetical protein
MQPKCKLCGNRTWRLVREQKIGKETLYFYQCNNNHLHILEAPIVTTENPLQVIG